MTSKLMSVRVELLALFGEMWAERDPHNVFDPDKCLDAVALFEQQAIIEGRRQMQEAVLAIRRYRLDDFDNLSVGKDGWLVHEDEIRTLDPTKLEGE